MGDERTCGDERVNIWVVSLTTARTTAPFFRA
jgi:hypothetical protein